MEKEQTVSLLNWLNESGILPSKSLLGIWVDKFGNSLTSEQVFSCYHHESLKPTKGLFINN